MVDALPGYLPRESTMSVPSLGDAVPQRGNAFSRGVSRWFLKTAGWRIEGAWPNRSKMVVIVAPHTSNWDFFVGVAVMFALGLRLSFLGKHSIFKPPVSGLLRWLGGIPVKRDENRGVVERTVGLFKERPQLILALSPEGTRRKTAQWRTGFYHIAHGARAPILPAGLDWGRKRIVFGSLLETSGDLETDLPAMRAFFDQFGGKRPDQYHA